jgi:serine/threonine protein kinase
MKIYDKVCHENILSALGVFFGFDDMLFLALRKFNLKDYLLDYGNDIKFSQLKQYCIQISDAMKYLHSKNILHCDLKVDNILVKDENGSQIEISDFGSAIDLDRDHQKKFVGTQTHTSYELLKHILNPSMFRAEPSEASDVWAFAVTMWQIFSKSAIIPSNFLNQCDIVNNYETGKRLPIPVTLSEEFWRYIILPCFDLHPKTRPSMEDLHKTLSNFREILQQKEAVDMEKSRITNVM